MASKLQLLPWHSHRKRSSQVITHCCDRIRFLFSGIPDEGSHWAVFRNVFVKLRHCLSCSKVKVLFKFTKAGGNRSEEDTRKLMQVRCVEF